MGDHNGPMRGFAPTGQQGDGRKPLPHIVTAVLSVLLSLVLAHFSGFVGKTGPAGPAGRSAINVGICAYFGPDGHGHSRFQVFTPNTDGTCTKGTLVSVVPGR